MKALLMVAAISGSVLAQDAGLRARELFYTPPPEAVPVTKPAKKKATTPAVSVANVPLGLRYSVMKRDADGKFVEVDQDANFHASDRIRLDFDTNASGYLYVLIQESSGNWSLLFPSPDVNGGNNRIEKGMSRQIPLAFDEQPRTEKLFLVLSRRPEADLDKLIYSAAGDRHLLAAKLGGDVVRRLRDEVKSLGLVFEKVDEMSLKYDGTNDVKTEKATYVVNPSRGDDARLAADVALRHK